MRKLFLFFGFGALALSQPGRNVTLTWTDTLNPTGTTYIVYRASGPCSGSSSFLPVASNIAVKTYDDNSLAPGNYCYRVTAYYADAESDPSTSVGAKIKPNPPQGLGAVEK